MVLKVSLAHKAHRALLAQMVHKAQPVRMELKVLQVQDHRVLQVQMAHKALTAHKAQTA
jgi:hypothetical protein